MSIPLDPRFIPAFSIEDVLLDKDTGAPLSGGQVFFFEDNQRSIAKPVYQITGNSPNYTFIQLPNPMILSSIGTFEDSLGNPVIPYFYPYDAEGNPQLYYIAVYSSGGVLQFTREAVPYLGEVNDVSVLSIITNELSNPQFVEVNFNTLSSYTYSFNSVSKQVINIAPSWDIVVTAPSIATVTLTQLDPQGTLNIPTNPANILNISSSGVTELLLRQRIFGSPNLWGQAFIAASFTGKTFNGLDIPISMYYSQSNGAVMNEPILTGTLPASGNYKTFNGSSAIIPASNSSDASPTAYVDVFFVIPPSIEIALTSIMLAYTGALPIADMDYDQETPDRQKDHLFHYYEPQLKFKPIPSYLVGWDFPLNPAQFVLNGGLGTQALGPNTSYYAWDQTIIFQTITNSISVSRVSNIGYLELTASGNTQAAIIQYLSGPQMQDLLIQALYGLSVCVRMGSTVKQRMTVSLWWTDNPSLPSLGGSASLVTGLDANGHPSGVVGGWNEIKIPYSNGIFDTLGSFTVSDSLITGFTDSAAYNTATFFAIVVGSSQILSGNVLNFGSVSLVPGLIATIPAPQTVDEVLRECQYYYETSYASVADFNTNPGNNSTWLPQQVTLSTTNRLYASPGSVSYKVMKRTNPVLTVYSLAKTSGNVSSLLYYDNGGTVGQSGPTDVALGSWNNVVKSNSFYITPNTVAFLDSHGTVSSVFGSGAIAFHWVVDARYGLV